jgi:perosamine synthetase
MRVAAQAYSFPEEDIGLVTGQLGALLADGAFLTMGRHVEEFEAAFAARHGGGLAAATSSGTSALEAILEALGVAGGEVVVPTNTFAATAFAVIRAGARPVFADVGPDLCIDPDDAARRITSRTRAVVTVHIGGLISPRTPDLVEACEQHGVPLVEDAAHAHGSALGDRPAGSFGVAAAFSFFSTKVITTGEGGMVLTRDPAVHDTVRVLRDQAKVGGSNLHEQVGASWRLTEVQAMLGIAQLARLDDFIARRQAIAERYRLGLAEVPGIEVLPVPPRAFHNFYKVIALLEGVAPEELRARLRADHDIALGGYVYDVPLHRQPVFRELADGPLPVAEDLCARHVCPPVYPALTDAQVDHVVAALSQALTDRPVARVGGR